MRVQFASHEQLHIWGFSFIRSQLCRSGEFMLNYERGLFFAFEVLLGAAQKLKLEPQ
jgi:hypothetical protein